MNSSLTSQIKRLLSEQQIPHDADPFLGSKTRHGRTGWFIRQNGKLFFIGESLETITQQPIQPQEMQ